MAAIRPEEGTRSLRTAQDEASAFYRLLKFLGQPLLKMAFRLRGEGIENIPPTGPFILAANHSSYIDPLVLGATCPRPIHFIMLREFWEKPVIGWICRKAGSFPVDQQGPATGALRRALSVLHEGKVLGIFPEGGRSQEERPLQAKGGVALLALKSGFPLLPAAIVGAEQALPKGRTIPRPVKVTVRYGTPMTFTTPSPERKREFLEKTTKTTMEAIARLSSY